MSKKLFTRTELKHIHYKLIQKGYTQQQAFDEVAGMIETAEINHEKARKNIREKRKAEARRREREFGKVLRESKNL